MDYSEGDLEGLKVDHAAEDFSEGQQYILTLKDQEVLGDHSEDEVLENVDIQQTFKQKLKAQKKKNLIAYQNKRAPDQDDDEFATCSLLAKYDNLEETAAQNKKAKRIQIGSEQPSETATGHPSSHGSDQQTFAFKKTVDSDYLEVSESVSTFRKKKGLAGKKRLKSEPVVHDDDEDIVALLEGGAQEQLQSRQARHTAVLEDKQVQQQLDEGKRANFYRAIEAKRTKQAAHEQDMFELDEDYSLIESQLQKQRQLKLNRQNQQARSGHHPAVSLVAETPQQLPTSEQLEISQTTEFEVGLQSITDKFKQQTPSAATNGTVSAQGSFSLSQAKQGLTSVVNVVLPSQRIKSRAVAPLLAASTAAAVSQTREETKIQIEEKLEQVEDVGGLEETIIGKGLGNALKVLRDRGMLNKDVTRGRTKDQTMDKQLAAHGGPTDGNQEADRVKLNYFDKKGRKLTIKEAYRQMCWKFHGRMPSHKNQEKMDKKMEAKQKVQSAFSGMGALGSLGGVPARKKK